MTTGKILLAGGVLGALALLVLGGGSSAAPAPAPGPQPGPAPGPGPVPNIDVLRGELDRLLAQADADPNSVDPDQMDLVAGELLAAGLGPEAAILRAKAAEVRVRRAGVGVRQHGGNR